MSRVNFKTDLLTYLNSLSGLTALVGNRIYSITSPQGTNQAHIIFNVINNDRDQYHDGPCSYFEPRVQFDVFSTSLDTAEQVTDQLEIAMEGIAGIRGSTNFAYAHLENERDDFETNTKEYRKTLDYLIMYK